MLFVSAKVSQLALLPQGKVEAANPETGEIRISNGYDFTNLNEFDITWEVLREGQVVEVKNPPKRTAEWDAAH